MKKNAYKNVLFLDFLFAVHRDCTDFIYFCNMFMDQSNK